MYRSSGSLWAFAASLRATRAVGVGHASCLLVFTPRVHTGIIQRSGMLDRWFRDSADVLDCAMLKQRAVLEDRISLTMSLCTGSGSRLACRTYPTNSLPLRAGHARDHCLVCCGDGLAVTVSGHLGPRVFC